MAFAQRAGERLQKQKDKVRAKKKAEAEKKRAQEDSVDMTVGSIFKENGVLWKMKEGRVCDGCERAEIKCNAHKKTCTENGVGQMGLEAGPLKKRRVVLTKGKGKEREK